MYYCSNSSAILRSAVSYATLFCILQQRFTDCSRHINRSCAYLSGNCYVAFILAAALRSAVRRFASSCGVNASRCGNTPRGGARGGRSAAVNAALDFAQSTQPYTDQRIEKYHAARSCLKATYGRHFCRRLVNRSVAISVVVI